MRGFISRLWVRLRLCRHSRIKANTIRTLSRIASSDDVARALDTWMAAGSAGMTFCWYSGNSSGGGSGCGGGCGGSGDLGLAVDDGNFDGGGREGRFDGPGMVEI
eukprot:599315-Prymnesium_polylepis.1